MASPGKRTIDMQVPFPVPSTTLHNDPDMTLEAQQ